MFLFPNVTEGWEPQVNFIIVWKGGTVMWNTCDNMWKDKRNAES